jgi:hypothetical protein
MNAPKTIANQTNDLRRDLRLVDAVGVGLGAIIGAGIFVVTGVAEGVSGASFIGGLLIAGIEAEADEGNTSGENTRTDSGNRFERVPADCQIFEITPAPRRIGVIFRIEYFCAHNDSVIRFFNDLSYVFPPLK